MNPFYTDNCPFCSEKLKITLLSGFTIYECPTQYRKVRQHYFHSVNSIYNYSVKAEIYLPKFYLNYSEKDTVIFKMDEPPKASYKYVCRLTGHFPINFHQPEETDQRLQL